MRVIPCIAFLTLTLTLAGCGSSAAYDDRTDKAAIQDVISSAWKAEYAGDEGTACLYYTKTFIEEQNRVWEAGASGALPHRKDCATGPIGYHPYLRFTNVRGFGNDEMRLAWTHVSPQTRTATAHPILPGGVRCLNPVDCHIVISVVIHLVGQKGGGWLINDLEASACKVHGSCVPLESRQVM